MSGFTDLLASCEAVIAKPGYGTFTEAEGNGVAVLYLQRPDWPESPFLERCQGVTQGEFWMEDWEGLLDRLMGLPQPLIG